MQQNNNVAKLVDKSIPGTIIGMAVHMLAGTFAMTMYQFTLNYKEYLTEVNVGKELFYCEKYLKGQDVRLCYDQHLSGGPLK